MLAATKAQAAAYRWMIEALIIVMLIVQVMTWLAPALLLGRWLNRSGIASNIGPLMRCSIGIAPNRYLAKVSTELQKPDGAGSAACGGFAAEAFQGCAVERQNNPWFRTKRKRGAAVSKSVSMAAKVRVRGS